MHVETKLVLLNFPRRDVVLEHIRCQFTQPDDASGRSSCLGSEPFTVYRTSSTSHLILTSGWWCHSHITDGKTEA